MLKIVAGILESRAKRPNRPDQAQIRLWSVYWISDQCLIRHFRTGLFPVNHFLLSYNKFRRRKNTSPPLLNTNIIVNSPLCRMK